MAIRKCYSYVRFSRVNQESGDSFQRQIKLSDAYTKKHGLTVDTSLNMHDLGKSGFFGEHTKEGGALGRFLQLVEQGRIEKGSLLIVESLDRLSREKLSVALRQFTSLLDKGISIVTLQDERHYTPEYDMTQLIVSITIMSRAYEESKTKQLRGLSSWEARRKNGKFKKITTMTPGWLRYQKETDSFEPIPERVKIIQEIFDMYLSGMGVAKVAKQLNNRGLPVWGKRKRKGVSWGHSYIWKILRNRNVIGHYQPKKFDKNRKYVNAGDEIKHYYPVAISDEIFYKTQDQLNKRKTKFGKTGIYANLFPHIAKCGYCGAPMHYVNSGNKGKTPQKYLVCKRAKTGANCKYISIRYPEFENSFLGICKQLNINDLITDTVDETVTKIDKLTKEVNVLVHKIQESKIKIEDMFALYSSFNDDLKATTKGRMEAEQEAINSFKVSLEEKRILLKELQEREQSSEEKLQNIQHNITILNTANDKELYNIRMQVQSQLLEIIERIDVYSYGFRPNVPKLIKHMQELNASDSNIKEMEEGLAVQYGHPNRNHRSYTVHFKDGGIIMMGYNDISAQYEIHTEIDEHREIKTFGGRPFRTRNVS